MKAKRSRVAKLTSACEGCGKTIERNPSQPEPRFCSTMCRYRPRPLVDHPTDPGAMLVPLSRGLFATIDKADSDIVCQRSWSAVVIKGITYAMARAGMNAVGGQRFVYLHQVISGVDNADHLDGDGLNNRRSNLRPASQAQNLANRRIPTSNTSGFKGVAQAESGRWRAEISSNGEVLRLGRFDSPEEAARAYDDAARELFGEFACVNFPVDGERGAREPFDSSRQQPALIEA